MYSEEFDQNEIVTMFSPSTANVSMKKERRANINLSSEYDKYRQRKTNISLE